MAASEDARSIIGMILKDADPKVLAAIYGKMSASESIAIGEIGPAGKSYGVFFTIPGTNLSSSMVPYVVTDRGMYIGYSAKAGFFKTVPAAWFLARTEISNSRRSVIREHDGRTKRMLEIQDAQGNSVSLFTLFVADPGTTDTFQRGLIAGIAERLGIPSEDGYDF